MRATIRPHDAGWCGLVVHGATPPAIMDATAAALTAAAPEVAGVVRLDNDRTDGGLLDQPPTPLAGARTLDELIAGVPVALGASEFAQVNPAQADALYAHVAALAEATPQTRAVDVYAGLGGIVAQYNPKEIQVDKSASWAQSTTSSGNSPEMQFTATNARALTLELFFDTYETVGPGGKPYDVHEEYIKKLQLLTYVMNPEGDEWERRPPRVMVLWGEDLPRFVGVVESVSTKYTMFLPGGRPVRATVSLKLTEALRTSNAPPGSTPLKK